MARPTDKKLAHKPAQGVPVQPPDIAPPDSCLAMSAPKWAEIMHMGQSVMDSLIDTVDPRHLERRITLLARIIIEDALWNLEGMTKKERVDAALRAISTFEGAKSKLWVTEGDEKDLPRTEQDYLDEKNRIEKRIVELAKKQKMLPKLVKAGSNDAFGYVEAQKGYAEE